MGRKSALSSRPKRARKNEERTVIGTDDERLTRNGTSEVAGTIVSDGIRVGGEDSSVSGLREGKKEEKVSTRKDEAERERLRAHDDVGSVAVEVDPLELDDHESGESI